MDFKKLFLPVLAVVALGFNCSDDRQLITSQENPHYSLTTLAPDNRDDRVIRFQPKYSIVRSYASGGGIFVVRELPQPFYPQHPAPNPQIHLIAQADLGAELITSSGGQGGDIFEVTINPSSDIAVGLHRFQIAVINDECSYRIPFEVDIYPGEWSSDSLAIVKRDLFLYWLETHYPEYGDLSGMEWESYFTYPGIWVVEHWTFLSDEYELRICWHVMIPPYDWSMLCIRERFRWNASLALRRESDGTISTIPVSEYPKFYGY